MIKTRLWRGCSVGGRSPRHRGFGFSRAPSDPPPPVAAPAVSVPLDVLLVALQRRVLRHAHLLRRRIEALAGIGGLLHLRRKVAHESKLLLHVLARAEPPAGSRMARDLAVPFQRQRAL